MIEALVNHWLAKDRGSSAFLGMFSALPNNRQRPGACCLRVSGFIIAFFLMLFCWQPKAHAALMLSKSLPHYLREMEFYYQRPRPEILAPLLKSLAENGSLARNDRRMAAAAFFAQLAREKRLDLEKLAKDAKNLGRDASRTIAWSAHLAQSRAESRLLDYLLDDSDKLLRSQIGGAPGFLEKWNILDEDSILHMYCSGFMATGSQKLLDAIIGAALYYGRLNAQGLRNRPGQDVGRKAASTLYDLAPVHDKVRKRLEAWLENSSGMDAVTLKTILRK